MQVRGVGGEGWHGRGHGGEGVAGEGPWVSPVRVRAACNGPIARRRGAHVHHVEQHGGGEEHAAPAVVEEVLVDEPQAEGEERRADEREELG